jgi:hypothetical protein
MNQNRSVVGALVVIGTLLILSGLGEQPPRKLQLVRYRIDSGGAGAGNTKA